MKLEKPQASVGRQAGLAKVAARAMSPVQSKPQKPIRFQAALNRFFERPDITHHRSKVQNPVAEARKRSLSLASGALESNAKNASNNEKTQRAEPLGLVVFVSSLLM